jgi:diaminohydroxyphosphoribosylaminopyrimidine deaminase/5-amino-6-(5-phosphoribosylamino)uracil reductase
MAPVTICKDNKIMMMNQEVIDEKYMRRCLQLARNGMQNAKPNPMVGAVITAADGRIIGEGYHVRCGEGHAEVNAFASVSKVDDGALLPKSATTLREPGALLALWSSTPPCADLIVSKGVRRVVVGCIDPFAKVQGRGIRKLRDAGIEVTVGVLERECTGTEQALHHVPYAPSSVYSPQVGVRLPTASSTIISSPTMISTPFTQMLSHKRLRAENDAILVGRM